MNSNPGPDFINIGVPRAGTTWLAKQLSEHPEIFIPKQKDLFFFNTIEEIFPHRKNKTNWSKGISWYLKKFSDANQKQVRGEIGTRYLYQDEALKKIKKYFPEIKIILFIREPSERLFSDYLKNKYEYNLPPLKNYLKENHEFLETGMYSKCIKNLFEIFPKEKVLICKYDDISDSPEKLVRTIYKFLDVDIKFKPKNLHRKVNTSNQKIITTLAKKHGLKGPKPLKKATYFIEKLLSKMVYKNSKKPPYLKNIYKKEILDLESITDLDLSSWKD